MIRIRHPAIGRTSVRARWCLTLVVAGYLVLAVVAGSPHSPLTTPLPIGAEQPGWTAFLANTVGLASMSRPVLTAISLSVMAAILGSFAVLLIEAWSNRVRLIDVLLAVGVSLAIAIAAPVLLSRDLFSYAAYGRIYAIYHHNPYIFVPASFPGDAFSALTAGQWLHARSVYGPAFTLASAAIVRAWQGSPDATILAFKVVAGASMAGATALTAIAARAIRPDRAALAAAVVGLNPVLVIHTVGGGHTDVLIALALAGALALAVTAPSDDRLTTRRIPSGSGLLVPSEALKENLPPVTLRSASVTTLLTLACLIKVVIVPALVLWVWWIVRSSPRRARARAATIHIALVVGLSAALVAPFLAGWHTFTHLASVGGVEAWASASWLVARGAKAFIGWLAGSAAGTVAGKTVLAGFGLMFAALLFRLGVRYTAREGRRPPAFRSAADAWGGALLLLALTSPYLLPWYVAWFAPFLGLMADDVLAAIGMAVAGLLALTLIPADPPHGLSAGGVMLGVHYGAAPLMLAFYIVAAWRVIKGEKRRRAFRPGSDEVGSVRRARPSMASPDGQQRHPRS